MQQAIGKLGVDIIFTFFCVGDFFSGCSMGNSRIHANPDDIPWENPQKSIIMRVFQPPVRIMMDFCGFSQGMSSVFSQNSLYNVSAKKFSNCGKGEQATGQTARDWVS